MPGAVKTTTLLDYNIYMTELIGTESFKPTHSPCQSDKGSPTAHKVNAENLFLSFVASQQWWVKLSAVLHSVSDSIKAADSRYHCFAALQLNHIDQCWIISVSSLFGTLAQSSLAD